MSIAEYQLSIKNLVDATTDEALLKRWKTQLETDVAQANKQDAASETAQQHNAEKKEDTSDYDIIESGLGIDE